jgi:hypothetical protein
VDGAAVGEGCHYRNYIYLASRWASTNSLFCHSRARDFLQWPAAYYFFFHQTAISLSQSNQNTIDIMPIDEYRPENVL